MSRSNFIIAMLAIFLGAPLTWEFMDRTPPYKVISGVTVPPQIKRGHEYRIDWTLDINPSVQCPGTVYRFLRDSQGAVWLTPPNAAAFGILPAQKGPQKIVGSMHKVPKDAATGRAEIYVRTYYICNFTQYLWPLTIVYDPVATEIVE